MVFDGFFVGFKGDNGLLKLLWIFIVFETAKKTEIEIRFPVVVFCSKNLGGLRGEPGFVRPSSVVVRVPKPESFVKNQAESADDGGGCMSAPTAKYGIAKSGELLGPKV